MDFHFAKGSPTARKVRIYLAEKGVTVTEHEKHRGFLPIEDIAPLNPNLTIPVLFDGDVAMYDSQVMVAYLLDKYPTALNGNPPLLPCPPQNFAWRPGPARREEQETAKP